jgi:uncharacterized membrane protein
MEKNRLEAFSDGVIAIIITVMVLEMHVPKGETWTDLAAVWPIFLSYVLSFLYVGIYWNNHHHLFQATRSIGAKVLWCNLHLLFWLSLLPFTTGWVGQNRFARVPSLLYGLNLMACAAAYTILQYALACHQGRESAFAQALRGATKEIASLALYLLGVLFAAFGMPLVGICLFASVACIWLVPDRRMESVARAMRSRATD